MTPPGQSSFWKWKERDLANREVRPRFSAKLVPRKASRSSATFSRSILLVDGGATDHRGDDEQYFDTLLEFDDVPLLRVFGRYVFDSAGGIEVTASFEPLETMANYLVGELSWHLPLALNWRKRIYFHGDGGLEWDMRYFYQFHTDATGNLLPEPDRNEWQYFGLDQIGPRAFTLWKSESESTSRLILHQGRDSSPFVQVYDEKGGVLAHFPEMAGTAPKSLRVLAAKGGAIEAAFWPSFQPPLDLGDSKAQTVFGVAHRISLQASLGLDEVVKARKSRIGLASSAPKPQAIDLTEESWLQKAATNPLAGSVITGGHPFPRGVLGKTDEVRIVLGNKSVPTQHRPLAYWPDESVKWALLSFSATEIPQTVSEKDSTSEPESDAPRITFRTGKAIPYEVDISSEKKRRCAGMCVEEHGIFVVDTGKLRLEISKGKKWLRSIQLGGDEFLDLPRATRLAYADYRLHPTQVISGTHLIEGSSFAAGVLEVNDLVVEENSPLRAVLRLEGLTDGPEPARLIMRLSVCANSTSLEISHTIELLSQDPRTAFLCGLGIDIPLRLEPSARMQFGGEKSILIPPRTSRAVLRQDMPIHYAVVKEEQEQTTSFSEGCHAHGWADIFDGHKGVAAILRNMWQQCPKALALEANEPSLSIELWPREGPPLDMRRYSNFPHVSQGEACPECNDNRWVDTWYYKSEPIVGLSRTHEILLHFYHDVQPDVEALSADFQSPPILYAGRHSYEKVHALLPEPESDKWTSHWNNLDNFTRFWSWHRDFHQWYGFWEFGDIQHQFKRGFGTTVSPSLLSELLKLPEAPPLCLKDVVNDYSPPNDWASDNGRNGWTNSEGLPNLFFQTQYLRTGNRTLYFAMEALAKSTRDVVVRHSGRHLGKGTRHGVQAWSDGNHEERQTTVTEFKLHYLLSGDGRTRDVVEKLYSQIYSRTSLRYHGDHSGRLGGLLMHWQMNGVAEEGRQFLKYIDCFLSEEGFYLMPDVAFPGPRKIGKSEELNEGNMFFHNFGGLHALLEYYELNPYPPLKEALIKMAECALNSHSIQYEYADMYRMYWTTIAFAARHAADPAPFRDFLIAAIRANWKLVYKTVSDNPEHWTGRTAFLTLNAPWCFFWVNFAGYILGVFPDDTFQDDVVNKLVVEGGKGICFVAPNLSWQSQYDNFPDLEPYLSLANLRDGLLSVGRTPE